MYFLLFGFVGVCLLLSIFSIGRILLVSLLAHSSLPDHIGGPHCFRFVIRQVSQ